MRSRLTDPADGLIRRAYRKSKQHVVDDQLTGVKRAPAAAFEPRARDEALSVNVESSLRAAGLPLLWNVDLSKFYAARVTVGDCTQNALEAFHEPVPPTQNDSENPHHGSICGLVEMRSSNPDAYEAVLTALAKASTIVPETDSSTPGGGPI
jgi:hypothetical protein